MRSLHWLALSVVALAPTASTAQTSDLARSLTQLVDSVVTTNKQRKILLELSTPLAYQPAAGPVDPANRNDPRNLDVAGVRLGMTVQQAQTAVRAAGYVDDGPKDGQDSYAAAIVYRWHTTYGYKGGLREGIPKQLVWKKGEETITVTIIALPEGGRVNEVLYSAGESAQISSAEFTRRALSKYGEPVNDDPQNLRWCTVKAPDCEDPRQAIYPVLEAFPPNRTLHLVGNDPARDTAFEQRVKADVDLRKPAERAPSF